jgi:hypothetical protein
MLVSIVMQYLRCPIMVEIWPEKGHIEHWVQTKKGTSVELESIVTHSLGDIVIPIEKWTELLMGPCKALFLQM